MKKNIFKMQKRLKSNVRIFLKGAFFVALISVVLLAQSPAVQSASITFGSSANIATSFAGDKQFVVVDLNGGTGKDIVSASNDDNEISWFQNNGSESFTERSVQTSYDARVIDVADLDADGDQDIIAAGFTEDTIDWWQNDGTPEDGGWTKLTIGSSLNGAYGVYVVDVDGDGDKDVLATAYIADDVVWYENDGTPGNGGWTINTIDANFDGAAFIMGTDLDGDGDRDVIVGANAGNAIGVYANNGAADPTFTLHTLDASADGVSGFDVADVDGDGKTDILAANTTDNQVKWYKNNGTISAENWIGYNVYSSYSGAYDVDAGDFDGDGDTDILASSRSSNATSWFENDGSVAANDDWTLNSITTATTPTGAEMNDLDEDGDLDAIGAHSAGISWLANTNIAPTLVSASITNLDDTDNVYAGLRTYNFRAVVSDANGTPDVSTVRLRFTQTTNGDPPQAVTTVFLYTASTNSFSRESGSSDFTVSGGSASTSGNQLTVTWNVTLGWSGIEQDDISLQARVADAAGATAGYTTLASSYFDTKTTLAVNTMTGIGLDVWQFTDATLNPDVSTGAITYDITYAGSSIQPPDSEITKVEAMRDPTGNPLPSNDVNETAAAGSGNDGTITVSTPSTLGSFTYSPKVTLSGGSTQTFDSTNTSVAIDRVKITDIAISNHVYEDSSGRFWDDNNGSGDSMRLSISAQLENAGTLLSGETATLGYADDADFFGTSGTFSNGVATLDVERNTESGSIETYDDLTVQSVGTGSVNVYGSTVNLNSQNDQDIGWDNAKPTLQDRTVTENSSSVYYNSSSSILYFSSLSGSVGALIGGSVTDTGSGAARVEFSPEGSFASSPSADTSLPSLSGTYTLNSSSGDTASPIEIDVIDNVGNTREYQVAYRKDVTAPAGYSVSVPSDPITDLSGVTLAVKGAADSESGVGATLLDISKSQADEPETARALVALGDRDDGTYYALSQVIDNVGNRGKVVSNAFTVDAVNEAPRSPSAGFIPRNGMRLANLEPTFSWNAASDPDPSDTESRLHYILRIDDDGEVIKNYDEEFTTENSEETLTLDKPLHDQTTYTYAVKTVDARGKESAFSEPMSFTVDVVLTPVISATQTVGVNIPKGIAGISFGNISELFQLVLGVANAADSAAVELPAKRTSFLTLFGATFILKNHTQVIQVFDVLTHPWLNYAMLIFFLLAVGYALGALRQQKPVAVPDVKSVSKGVGTKIFHLWIFLTRPPAESFHRVAPRDESGTWIYPYSTYQGHHRFSRVTAGAAMTLVTVKIFAVIFLAALLITQAHRVIGQSPYANDGDSILPRDTATFRVDLKNTGDAAATNVKIWSPVPQGTEARAGSAKLNGAPVTDAADSDAVTFDGAQYLVRLPSVDVTEEVYFEFSTVVVEPAPVADVESHSVIAWTENQAGRTTNTTSNPVVSGSLSGQVWNDQNKNGVRESSEAGVGKVSLNLYRDLENASSLDVTKDSKLATVSTATDGTYVFQGLGVGVYWVIVDGGTLPAGFSRTTESGLHKVSLVRGGNYQSASFGYVGPVGSVPLLGGRSIVPTSNEISVSVQLTPQEVSDELLSDFRLVSLGTGEEKKALSKDESVSIQTKNGVIVLQGFAAPFQFVTVYIFSEPLVFTTQADANGKWEVHVATELLDAGEHRVLAEVKDETGRTSDQIEIAKIVVEKELSTINVIVYSILVIVIIALTVLVVLLILRRDVKKNPQSPTSPTPSS